MTQGNGGEASDGKEQGLHRFGWAPAGLCAHDNKSAIRSTLCEMNKTATLEEGGSRVQDNKTEAIAKGYKAAWRGGEVSGPVGATSPEGRDWWRQQRRLKA